MMARAGRVRALMLLAMACAALLLGGCSPDDAAAARVAAGALKARVQIALAAHSELLVRAMFEAPDSDEQPRIASGSSSRGATRGPRRGRRSHPRPGR